MPSGCALNFTQLNSTLLYSTLLGCTRPPRASCELVRKHLSLGPKMATTPARRLAGRPADWQASGAGQAAAGSGPASRLAAPKVARAEGADKNWIGIGGPLVWRRRRPADFSLLLPLFGPPPRAWPPWQASSWPAVGPPLCSQSLFLSRPPARSLSRCPNLVRAPTKANLQAPLISLERPASGSSSSTSERLHLERPLAQSASGGPSQVESGRSQLAERADQSSAEKTLAPILRPLEAPNTRSLARSLVFKLIASFGAAISAGLLLGHLLACLWAK